MHKHRSDKEFMEMMRKKVTYLYPDIYYDSEKLLKKYKGYPGLKGNPNYQPIPGVYGTDIRWLHAVDDLMTYFEKNASNYDSEERLPYPNFSIKDVTRLGNIMSEDLDPTYPGFSTLVDQEYREEFKTNSLNFLDYIMKSVGFRFGVYVSKDKESSNGAGLRTNDIPSFAYMIDHFIEMWPNKEYQDVVFNTPNPLFLLTRRMAKPILKPDGTLKTKNMSNKDGVVLPYSRDVSDKIKDKLESNHIDSKRFGRPIHRAANNVQEIERMTQIIAQPFVEALKDTFPTIFKTIDGLIGWITENNPNIHWASSDGASFDQSVPQWMIDHMCSNLTEVTGYTFDFLKLEHSKDIVWWDEEKGRFTSLTTLCKEHIKASNIPDKKKNELLEQINIIGLSSGNPFTNIFGKLARVATEYSIIKEFFKPSLTPEEFLSLSFTLTSDEVIATCQTKGLILNDCAPCSSRFITFNSSDDNTSGFTNIWFRDVYNQVLAFNFALKVRWFLPVEPDPEYLAYIKNLTSDNKTVYAGNLIRKFTSLVATEYSAEVAPGLYKDYRLSMASKKEGILAIPGGQEAWNEFNNIFKKYFDKEFETYITDFLKDKPTVSDMEFTNDIIKKYQNNPAVKAFLDNKDKVYYVDWIRENLPDEVKDLIYYNIGPDKMLSFYKNMGKEDVMFDNYNKYYNNSDIMFSHINNFRQIVGLDNNNNIIPVEKLKLYRDASKFHSLTEMELSIEKLINSEKKFMYN